MAMQKLIDERNLATCRVEIVVENTFLVWQRDTKTYHHPFQRAGCPVANLHNETV
jgi:hypothetical protein